MIFVSGATGNVGKELVGFLLDKGVKVRILVRDPKKAAHWSNRVEIAVGDLDQPETLLPAMQGVEKLYFVTPDPKQVTNLLTAAKKAGVRHVVKQSNNQGQVVRSDQENGTAKKRNLNQIHGV